LVREQIFEPAVEQMRQDFDNHPVTREIENGNASDNISDTLIGVKSKDNPQNLFSFIGFENGSDPVSPIRNILDEENESGPKVKYIRGSQQDGLRFKFAFTPPSKEEMFNETPMPWAEGLSWADRIEKGIPGITHFLSKPGIKGSRSEGGIQVDANISPGARFRNVSYISGIINKFLENIRRGTRRGI
jgi:hypothetical protein